MLEIGGKAMLKKQENNANLTNFITAPISRREDMK